MKDEVDASSPVGILEDYFRTSESETSSTKSICSDFDAQQNSKPASRWRTFSESLRTRSMKHLSQLHSASVLKLTRRGSRTLRENASMQMDSVGDNSVKSHWKNFTLSEIQNATNNFNPGNLIGKGGYAEVYRGCLKTGNLVAIKRLIRGSVEERSCDFLSELGIMAHVDHPNTAKLIGYGVEGGMHLVLELSPHGSLASWLQGSTNKLQWSIRYKIALGTAEGLVYLHEGCKRRIVHRDIKAANILLTKDFEPQICDFGLAKWLPEQWTHHTVSKFEGTFGYLAPEYLMHGIVDEKTDVFAFGVLLLELITGRRALNHSLQSLVMWAKPLIRKNKVRELVDPSLSGGYDSHQMNLMVLAASLCVKQSSLKRPQMSQVLQVLKGSLSCLDGTGLRHIAFYRRAFVKETLSLNTKEYDSGDELNDINQLKQLAFG